MIGRAGELDGLAHGLARARADPSAIRISGEAGIGKSTVWRAGVALAGREGFRILAARPAEPERELSFAVLRDLLERVELPAHIPDPQRRALETAIRNVDPEGPSPDQLSVAVAMTNLLRDLAADRLLVAIDDAQWIDEPSAHALRYAMRRLRGPIGILVAVRGPGTSDPIVSPDAFGEGFTSIELGPLPMSDLFRLLQDRTGAAFSRPVVSRIEAVSGGNPFYALEMGRAIVQTGEVPDPGTDLPIPDTLIALIDARFRSLPASTVRTLAVAALATDPTITTVSEAAETDALETIAAALDARIATIEAGEILLDHPLLAAAIVDRLDQQERRKIHARLALAEPNPEARARHLARANTAPDAGVAAVLEDAALAAGARGAPATAAELWALAVKATPKDDPHGARRRSGELAGARFLMGDIQGAAAILEGLLHDAPPGAERAKLQLTLAKVRFEQRSSVEAVALCDEAIRHAKGDGALLARIEADAAQFCDFDMERRATFARAAWKLLSTEPDARPESVSNALTALALAELCLGNGLREDLIGRAIDLQESYTPVIVSRRATTNLGEFASRCDRADIARPLLEEALETCRRSDDSSLSEALWTLAELDLVTGRWPEALDALREGLDVATGDEQPAKALEVLTLLAPLEAATGHETPARRHAETALEIAATTEDPVPTLLTNIMLGTIAVHTGDAEAAAARLSLADREDEREHLHEPGFRRYMADLAEALVETGQIAMAEDVIDRLQAMGEAVDRPSALAGAARGRALLAASRGEFSVALESCALARTHHERAGDPFQLARTLLLEGRIRRRSRQKRDARAALEGAIDIFGRLGADPWLARSKAELNRIGGRLDAPDELTETERRVAHLAAQGHTNKEIASTLFISSRTVEANLTRIYRKLRVPSRAALGQRLADLDAG